MQSSVTGDPVDQVQKTTSSATEYPAHCMWTHKVSGAWVFLQ